MHHILSNTRFHRFASFRVEQVRVYYSFGVYSRLLWCTASALRPPLALHKQDFVEAPSQALENWCWVPSILALMSGHFETGEPLPEELAARLAKSRRAHSGLFNTRQVRHRQSPRL